MINHESTIRLCYRQMCEEHENPVQTVLNMNVFLMGKCGTYGCSWMIALVIFFPIFMLPFDLI